MKNIIIALLSLVVLVSCQKEYTGEILKETPGTVATGGDFRAKINSVQFVADKGAGAVFTVEGDGAPAMINISGLSIDKKAIMITVEDSGVHKYFFSDDAFSFAGYIDSTLSNTELYSTEETAEDTAGYVEITSINTAAKTMSGTFSFKMGRGTDSTKVEITEGTFTNIPYISGAVLPPSSSKDTFHVKISNNLFTPFSISGNSLAFNHTIMLQGSDSTALKTVGITVPDNITPGSYSMDSFGYYGLYNDGTSSLGSVSGTLQVLENNTTTKRIRANFHFRAEDPTDPTNFAELTEGYFSVQYK